MVSLAGLKLRKVEKELRIVFFAMSSTQRKQYKYIINKLSLDGYILHNKWLSRGRFITALRWMIVNHHKFNEWMDFDLKKNKIKKKGKSKILLCARYKLEMWLALASFIRLAMYHNINIVVLRNGASHLQQPVISWAQENGIKIAYLENGQLPGTTVIDGMGVNAESSIPRDKQFYLNLKVDVQGRIERSLIPRKPKKHIQTEKVELPSEFIFVPFQVPYDTQVIKNSKWVKSLHEFYLLLEEVLESLPDNVFFVVKEHPSSEVTYPEFYEKNKRIMFSWDETEYLIRKSKAVLTLNSSVGVEALMLGKVVITLGEAFYNIDGLAFHAKNIDKLKRFLREVNSLKVDQNLLVRFIWWLDNVYFVKGKLREFHCDESSLLVFKGKLQSILEKPRAV